MKYLPAGLLCAVLLIGPSPAFAQQQSMDCYTRSEGLYPVNTFPNPAATKNLIDTFNRADPQAMARLAGVWYGEVPDRSGATASVSRNYLSYEANGLFQYQGSTCGPMVCSDNQGVGQWAGYNLPDGRLYIMGIGSDLVVTQSCSSGTYTFETPNSFTDEYGNHYQRVR